jgi:tetratricopeptide (TPR) repeat protein
MKKTLNVLSLVALTLLLTFCKSDPNIEQAKMDLNRQDFSSAIAAADKAIELTPETGMGYYYKALAFKGMAEAENNASLRTESLKKMAEYFSMAEDKFSVLEKVPAELELIDQNKITLWAREFNEAVQIAQSDSLKAIDGKLAEAVAHMDNAKVIMPDSLNNVVVATELYLMNGQKDMALSSLQEYKDNPNVEPDVNTYLRIALLQAEIADNKTALATLNEGRAKFPENVQIVQQTAQLLLEEGETEKALTVVKQLIEIDPSNSQYRMVYGTQLYQSVDVIAQQLADQYDILFDLDQEYKKAARITKKAERESKVAVIEKQRVEIQSRINEIQEREDVLTAQATEQLIKVSELRPNDHSVQYTIAIIYQNKAAAYQKQRDNELDNKKAAALDEKASEQLKKSLGFYEKAADLIGQEIAEEKDATNKAELMERQQGYWNSLFRVYTNLGMTEKATVAMEKAGI